MPRLLILIPALAAGALLAACGDDGSDQGATPATDPAPEAADGEVGHGEEGHDGEASPVAPDARRVEVAADALAFEPAEITAQAGEDLAIVLTSEDILHDFTIDELDAHVAADVDETVEGGVRPVEPGEYTYYCSVPGHREAGMEGTLIVE